MSYKAADWKSGVEDVTLNGNPDFAILATEYERDYGTKMVRRTRTFKVSGDSMSATAASNDFKSACQQGLTGFTIEGIRLWLRIIHNSVVADQLDLSIEEVWNALAFGTRYGLPFQKMEPWYNKWFQQSYPNRHSIALSDLKMLLFPSYTIGSWRHFAYVTKQSSYLATGFMKEDNPSRYDGLHTPSRVLDQINAARGSMRRELNEALLDIACPDNFCLRKCKKRAECYITYMEEVTLTKLWPFSTQHRIPIQTVLDSPGMTNWTHKKILDSCMDCFRRLKGDHVHEAREKVEKYWEGMCLDCVKLSLDKAGTRYAAYFSKDKSERWGAGCQVFHGRNEWYFSFMGSQDVMVQHQEDRGDF
ncbi:hypothetical protein ONS95_012564 [Cadophora gregata]|uniref:uncharacterized protein n=1 Tax=Cadophora gregata TaxID=51156 RepID=UPI0026DCE778|nr:uncharacterized protein ONS95_012564 [Cadophora gregata]KAK0118263.1 hypothetical protein ONS95_012564 [Cadophora gregata]KAK0123336.1 hypothetical protein ONS96_010330 [Cadophora gregata f. sp. sojae]